MSDELTNRLMTFIDQTEKRLQSIESKVQYNEDEKKKLDLLVTKVVDKLGGIESKTNELSPKTAALEDLIGKNKYLLEKTSNDFDNLSKKVEEINNDSLKKIEEVKNSLIEQINSNKAIIDESIESLKASFYEQLTTQSTSFSEFKAGLDERLTNLQNTMNNQNEESMELIQKLMEAFKQLTTKLDTTKTEINQKIDTENTNLIENINTMQKNVSEDFNEVKTSIDQNQNKIQKLTAANEQFYKIVDNYGHTLESHASLINQFREELPKYTNLLKDEQAEYMKYFERILGGLEESIRSEIIVIGKSARQMLEEWRKESDDIFFRKDDAQEIFARVESLDKDVRVKADSIRSDMMKNLSESMIEFKDLLQQALSTVGQYREDYSAFKEETQALVERRVNEKFDFIFDILTKTVAKSDELKTLVMQMQIPPALSPSLPVNIEVKQTPENNTSEE